VCLAVSGGRPLSAEKLSVGISDHPERDPTGREAVGVSRGSRSDPRMYWSWRRRRLAFLGHNLIETGELRLRPIDEEEGLAARPSRKPYPVAQPKRGRRQVLEVLIEVPTQERG
jgi:hypothetical protein